jgi:hypothetical protein
MSDDAWPRCAQCKADMWQSWTSSGHTVGCSHCDTRTETSRVEELALFEVGETS